jgi:hypothetical protein
MQSSLQVPRTAGLASALRAAGPGQHPDRRVAMYWEICASATPAWPSRSTASVPSPKPKGAASAPGWLQGADGVAPYEHGTASPFAGGELVEEVTGQEGDLAFQPREVGGSSGRVPIFVEWTAARSGHRNNSAAAAALGEKLTYAANRSMIRCGPASASRGEPEARAGKALPPSTGEMLAMYQSAESRIVNCEP